MSTTSSTPTTSTPDALAPEMEDPDDLPEPAALRPPLGQKVTVSLAILIQAEAKVGKTWLTATAPKPLLIFDSEGGARFLPRLRKIVWDPHDPPPDMTNHDVCIVYVRQLADLSRGYEWLKTGKHPFRSVAIDTLTELQKRIVDKVVGDNPDIVPEQADWGKIFRHGEQLIRKMRDLTFHPTRPLECFIITTHTHMEDGKFRPLVKGQLKLTLPGIPDVIGYLHTATNAAGKIERRLAIQPVWNHVLAGDRTHVLSQTMGAVIAKPNLTKMLEAMAAGEEEATT